MLINVGQSLAFLKSIATELDAFEVSDWFLGHCSDLLHAFRRDLWLYGTFGSRSGLLARCRNGSNFKCDAYCRVMRVTIRKSCHVLLVKALDVASCNSLVFFYILHQFLATNGHFTYLDLEQKLSSLKNCCLLTYSAT